MEPRHINININHYHYSRQHCYSVIGCNMLSIPFVINPLGQFGPLLLLEDPFQFPPCPAPPITTFPPSPSKPNVTSTSMSMYSKLFQFLSPKAKGILRVAEHNWTKTKYPHIISMTFHTWLLTLTLLSLSLPSRNPAFLSQKHLHWHTDTAHSLCITNSWTTLHIILFHPARSCS